MLFFEAQLLVVDEGPDRTVIHLQPARRQFRHQPAQGEVLLYDPGQQPDPVRACDRPRFIAADLARCHAAGFAQPPCPPDNRTDAHAKLRRRSPARHPALLNRSDRTLPKINGIGSAHRMLASSPASILNQNQADLGIPNRFTEKSSRFSVSPSILTSV